jgi:hypothetical protein
MADLMQFSFLHKIILRCILCKKLAALNFLKQKKAFLMQRGMLHGLTSMQ